MFSFPSYHNPFAPEELQGKIGYKICSLIDEKKNQLADQSSKKRGRVKCSCWVVAVMDLDQRTAYSCLAWHNFLATRKAYPPLDLKKKIITSELWTHTERQDLHSVVGWGFGSNWVAKTFYLSISFDKIWSNKNSCYSITFSFCGRKHSQIAIKMFLWK